MGDEQGRNTFLLEQGCLSNVRNMNVLCVSFEIKVVTAKP